VLAASVRTLHTLSTEYIRSRRAYGELRTRLVTVAHERSRLTEGIPVESMSERLQEKLGEIERVRSTLERSARVADERLRGLESVIVAAVRAAVERERTAPPDVTAPQPLAEGPPARAPRRIEPIAPPVMPRPAAPEPPETTPWIRGGFSEPEDGH
jgi:hypothetical protein